VTSFRGCAYGLLIEANRPIPGLAPSQVAPAGKLEMLLGTVPDFPGVVQEPPWYTSAENAASGRPNLQVWAVSGGLFHRLLYADDTEFLVDAAGARVWARWPDCLSVDDMATYLLGPVMGFVLLLRGVVCLHASAVVVGGSAVAVAGQSEAGKSTIAAVFAGRGYPVLSDDVVTLDESDGEFLVHPASPRIRLWPESAIALYGAADALPRLTPTWDKRYLDLTTAGYQFQNTPMPLSAVYVLAERQADAEAPRVENVPGRDALVSLVANTYVTRLMDRAMHARGFDLLGRLVRHVPVRRIVPHSDPGRLDALCDVLLDDFHALPAAG
jgi:hypothetical protein